MFVIKLMSLYSKDKNKQKKKKKKYQKVASSNFNIDERSRI